MFLKNIVKDHYCSEYVMKKMNAAMLDSSEYTLEPETGLGIPRNVLLRIKPIMPPYLPASAFRTQIVFELMG